MMMLSVACLGARLWSIDAPSLDRTSWKEIDYIYVSTAYWENGFRFLYPEVGWPAEAPRYTSMEFPLVPYLAGIVYSVWGYDAFSVRCVPLFSFLLITVYVFFLAKEECGERIGLLAAVAAAVLPLSHPFGRYLHTEPTMIAMSVMCLYHYVRWTSTHCRGHLVAAWFGFSLALALKPTSLYLLLPLAHATVRANGWGLRSIKGLGLLVLPSLVLPAAWYAWAYHLASHYLEHFSIFGGHDKFQTLTMLSDPDWYVTMVGRVAKHVLGGIFGSGLGFVGLVAAAATRKGGIFWSYLAAITSFFVIVAEGNLDAPYRQLTLVPSVSVFVAYGAAFLGIALAERVVGASSSVCRVGMGTTIGAVLILMIPIINSDRVLFPSRDRPYWGEKWRLAKIIRSHTDSRSKIVTVGEYTIHKGGNDISPMLYYYSGLQGWTLQRGDWDAQLVDSLIDRGATHLVAVEIGREPDSLPFIELMRNRYAVLHEGPKELLLDLRAQKNERPDSGEGVPPSTPSETHD